MKKRTNYVEVNQPIQKISYSLDDKKAKEPTVIAEEISPRDEDWNNIKRYFGYFVLWLFVCGMTISGFESAGFNAGPNFAQTVGFLLGTAITGAIIFIVTLSFKK
jgi:hypothetical protein